MLDVRILRNELNRVEEALNNRGKSLDLISGFTELDTKRRELLQESEALKNQRNTVSAEVAKRKKTVRMRMNSSLKCVRFLIGSKQWMKRFANWKPKSMT